jgi:mannose-6-phosphate isomerase-like protein (cupin superfamily)
MTGTPRSRRFPCTISGTTTTAGSDVREGRDVAERTLRTAEIKEWWASVFRLVDRPEAAAWIFRAHEPDGAGLCKVCASPSYVRNLPWPCPTHGTGFPGHVHDDYEEVFYVLAGQIQYLIDNDWTTAPAGSTVFIPPGRVHAFRNVGAEPARHLAIASPADARTMIEEALQADPPARAAVFARHRSRLVD